MEIKLSRLIRYLLPAFISFCDMMLKGFLNETNPKTPYAGVLIWYLQDMLNKLGKNADF